MSARAYRLLFWLGLLLLVIVALGLVQSILLPFATGFVIAYVLAPVVAWFERRGVPRSVGSLLVLILFLIGVAGILVVLVPLIQGQIVELITRVPNLVRALQDLLGKLILVLQEHVPAEDAVDFRRLDVDPAINDLGCGHLLTPVRYGEEPRPVTTMRLPVELTPMPTGTLSKLPPSALAQRSRPLVVS